MDRELPDRVIQKKKLTRIIQIALFCSIPVIIIFSLRFVIKPSIKKSGIRTAVVETGNLESSVTASGIVVPEFEEIKTSPIQSGIKAIYRNTGDEVVNGDSVLSLDTRLILYELEKLRDELNIKKDNIRQLQLQEEKNISDLRTQYDIKRLQVQNMASELETEKYLNTIGGGTRENTEKAELNLKISRLELEQISQSIQYQEKTMRTNLSSLGYEINIQQKNVNELQYKINHSTIIADKKGIITWINNQIGKNINQGDELVKISDLQSYRVIGSISDIHASNLGLGQKVIVRLNENTDLRGEIVNISPSVSDNNIKFNISLESKTSPLLRPNLKVDVQVITSLKEKVLLVKNGAFYKGGIKQPVFVIRGNKLINKQVSFGDHSVDFVEIVSGLKDKDEVVISDMSDYEKHNSLRLKEK